MDTLKHIDAVNGTEEMVFKMPRKANDVIREAMAQKQLPPLFDGFWQTGELALLFGAAGVGKSILAVQLADSLARGRPIDGFKMPRRRHKVLYVDLMLRDVQFQRRYTPTGSDGPNATPYKFAERFYHGRPGEDDDLCSWVETAVSLGGFEVVVIDDLSALMRTDDGTFDSLKIMRKMKRLSQTKGVSILMLADSFPSPRGGETSESDLRRSRVLCGVADSVFAIGRLERGDLKLVQFRVQGSEVVWGSRNPVGCTIRRRENGLLGFDFDERFAPKLDPERCRLICEVNEMWGGEGMKIREIADKLGMSKSRVSRLFHAWTPAVYEVVHGKADWTEFDDYDDDDDDEYDENRYISDADVIDVTPVSVSPAEDADGKMQSWFTRISPENLPFAAGLRRRSIYDLQHAIDGYGREIFVESRSEHTGKPTLWYRFDDKTGTVIRSRRDSLGVTHERIGKSGWI